MWWRGDTLCGADGRAPLACVRESAGMLQLGSSLRIERKISGHKDLNSERKRKGRKLGIQNICPDITCVP